METPDGGQFTNTLLATWREGQFKGTYQSFFHALKVHMPPAQTPSLTTLGHANGFLRESPFSL